MKPRKPSLLKLLRIRSIRNGKDAIYPIDAEASSNVIEEASEYTLKSSSNRVPRPDVVESVSFFGLFKYASRFDTFLVGAGILSAVLCGTMQVLSNYIQGAFADVLLTYGADTSSPELWNKGMQLVLASAVLGISTTLVTFCMFFCHRLSCINITNTLKVKFLEAVLRQEAAWLDKQKFGVLAAQLSENIEHVQIGIGEKLGLMARGFSMAISCIIISLAIDWPTSLSMFPMLPFLIVSTVVTMKLINRAAKRQISASEEAHSILHQSIMEVKTLQSCNGQEHMVKKYEGILAKGRVHGIVLYLWQAISNGLFYFSLWTFFGIGLYVGGLRLLEGQITGGSILAAVNSVSTSGYMIGVICPILVYLARAKQAAASIYTKIERKPAIESDRGVELPKPIRGEIAFSGVKFAYPTRTAKPALVCCDWSVASGQTMALVGHSGSGKSTCFSLLTRLHNADAGQILIDGVEVGTFKPSALRKLIGIVSQEPALFHGTIFENITLGDPSVDLDRVEDVCRMANAHGFITKLEKGYQTRIGAGGLQLSGGQKQRLAIARALIRDPKILLLDEATSALDAESEILVQNALRAAAEGRTTIIIAHRLSTLRGADKIVVMDEGRVVETGSHEQLIAERPNGLYAMLVAAQQFEEVAVSDGDGGGSDLDGASPQEVEREEQPRPDPMPMVVRARPRGHSITQASIISGSSRYGGQNDPVEFSRQASAIEGETIVQQPQPSQKHPKSPFWSSGLALLYRNCDGNYGKLVVAIFLTAVRGTDLALYIIATNFLYVAYGHALNEKREQFREEMFWIGGLNVIIGILAIPVVFGAIALFGWVTERVSDKLKRDAMRNVLDLDAAFFDQPHTSNAHVAQRISTDSLMVKAGLDTRLYSILANCMEFLFLVPLSIFYCWQLTLAGTAICFVELGLFYVFGKRIQELFKHLTIHDNSATLATEIVENAKTVQLLAREEYFLSKYQEELKKVRPRQIKAALYEAFIYAIARAFIFFNLFIAFGYGIYLIYLNAYEPRAIFVQSNLFNYCIECIMIVAVYLNDFLRAGPSTDSLFELIRAENSLRGLETGREIAIEGEVELDGVNFAYPIRPNHAVTKGLSLKASRGETIALVGPSGGGKSSVFQLLERFYDRQAGALKIDGHLVEDFTLHSLRSQIGLVGQEPILFAGTVAENILLGVENAGMDDVREACRLANATKFIAALPDGYATEVGEKGAQLSGGQKQRIAIARALVRKPKILLLDEATSALDAQSEQAVQKALDAASIGRTCITIAHRLSSIQNAHRIYFIRAGKTIESGNHWELMRRGDSAYAAMARKQEIGKQH